MSTPCTIKCIIRYPVKRPALTVHLYKHWDGYPEGIANLLVRIGRVGGHIAEQLIRYGDCTIEAHVDEIDCVHHRYEIEIDLYDPPLITHHDMWDNKRRTLKVEHFIDDHYGRCCPLCGHRPKHEVVNDGAKLPSAAIVRCIEHPQFTGKGNNWPLAIARYNRAALAHIREESEDA